MANSLHRAGCCCCPSCNDNSLPTIILVSSDITIRGPGGGCAHQHPTRSPTWNAAWSSDPSTEGNGTFTLTQDEDNKCLWLGDMESISGTFDCWWGDNWVCEGTPDNTTVIDSFQWVAIRYTQDPIEDSYMGAHCQVYSGGVNAGYIFAETKVSASCGTVSGIGPSYLSPGISATTYSGWWGGNVDLSVPA